MELVGRVWVRDLLPWLAAVFRLARYNGPPAGEAMGLSIKAGHDLRPVRGPW